MIVTHFTSERNCLDCNAVITFDEFLLNHPQYTRARALLIWNDKLLSIFCTKCFLHAPEKPYKQNKYTYFQSYIKHG